MLRPDPVVEIRFNMQLGGPAQLILKFSQLSEEHLQFLDLSNDLPEIPARSISCEFPRLKRVHSAFFQSYLRLNVVN